MPGKAFIQNAIIAALNGDLCRTTAELCATTGESRKAVPKATCALVSRGLAQRVETGCFKLTKAGLAAKQDGVILKSGPVRSRRANHRPKARVKTHRTRIWRAIRQRRKFTVDDLEMLTAGKNVKSPRANIQRYVSQLHLAGIITALPRRLPPTTPTSNGCKQYVLLNDCGPLPPVYQPRHNRIFDPNKEEFIPCGQPGV